MLQLLRDPEDDSGLADAMIADRNYALDKMESTVLSELK
jgi:hypothetical protein